MYSAKEKIDFIQKVFGRCVIASDSVNVAVQCPSCGSGNESKKKFSIRIDTDVCHCWICGLKAKSLSPNSMPLISETIKKCLKKLNKENYIIDHIYLNYYETGDMWTPNHNHKGTHQLIISLGGTRTLNVAKKDFKMKSGDTILFGSSIHGVPKEPNSEPRISIAAFMKPC